MKHLRNTYYNKLVRALAELYPLQLDIQAMAARLTINAGELVLHGKGVNMWDSLLSKVQAMDKVELLLDTVLMEKPGQPTLLEVQSVWRSGTGIEKQITFEPANGSAPAACLIYDGGDSAAVNPLKVQFRILSRNSDVRFYDTFDELGQSVSSAEKNEMISKSQLILLMLTPGFFANDDNGCMAVVTSSVESGKRVVPVLLQNCLWNRVKLLKGIVPLPMTGDFIEDSPLPGKAYTEVASRIEKLLLNKN